MWEVRLKYIKTAGLSVSSCFPLNPEPFLIELLELA